MEFSLCCALISEIKENDDEVCWAAAAVLATTWFA
jgi:hypothetical protein